MPILALFFLESEIPVIVSGGVSLISLLSIAYFAGKFSEKIRVIEETLESKSEETAVEKDLAHLEAQQNRIEATLRELSLEMKNVQATLNQLAGTDRKNPFSARKLPG